MKKKSGKKTTGLKSFPQHTKNTPGKYTPKKFQRDTKVSTGHKAYRQTTGTVMEGYFTSEVGSNNKSYLDKMSEGY